MKGKIAKYAILWAVVIVAIVISVNISPSMLYFNQSITVHQINFDGPYANTSDQYSIVINNETANARTYFDVYRNISISKIIVPKIRLPDQAFSVEVFIENMGINPQNLRVSCSIFALHSEAPMLGDVYIPLGWSDNAINSTIDAKVNCTSIRDRGLIKTEIRLGKIIQPGINTFTIDISGEKGFCAQAIFPIEIKSDLNITQVTNGIAICFGIVGFAMTATWIWFDKKGKRKNSTSPSTSKNRDEESLQQSDVQDR